MTAFIPQHLLSDPMFKWELTIKETFSLDGMYKRIYFFLVHEGWTDPNGKDNYETYYNQKDDGGVTFHYIWWRAMKTPDAHGNEYYKFYMTLDFNTVALKKKETIVNGQKVELDNGEFKVNCQLFLSEGDSTTDKKAGENWDTHPILRLFKHKFWKRTNKHIHSAAKSQLLKFNNDLYELIQTYTGVKEEGPAKDFFPSKGAHN